jgi:hypothetical protein
MADCVSALPHAATKMGSAYYCYDGNGNMTRRNATSAGCTDGDVLTIDFENRLSQNVSGGTIAQYGYDRDSARDIRTARGIRTAFGIRTARG